ncbi:MAG: hypothetical protein A2076_13195 [Geobacteraceae bacterium GWC2_53_11]|nr:MAG: hypothetical protein A2076_13195 [Geobacteraceae bacterium GWC2_53_11]
MAALAKLKLVMEIDGDKAVVTGVERVDAAIDRTARNSQSATERMAAGMGNVETATGKMAAGMGGAETATGMMTLAAGSLYSMLQRVIGAWTAWEIVQKGKDATMFAANMQMAERAIGVVGNQTGHTVEMMTKYRDGLKDINITSMASTSTIAMMARAGLDLDGAIPLARLAQGAARMKALRGETVSSSSALDSMINGIITMQPEMLKQFGITATVEGAMRRYKQATGESAEALTEQQRVQLFFNDVLKDGQPLMSLYVNTLDLAASKISSSQRPVEELKLALGQLFLPELNVAATAYYNTVSGGMKWVKQHSSELGALSESITLLSSALITGGEVYLGYLLLFKGPAIVTAIAGWVQAFHAGQVANAEFSSQLAAGNVVQLNSVQATAMKTAAQAESAQTTASAALAELDHAAALQAGLVAEREITVAKLQNVIANESLIKSQVTAAEIELSQAALRTEAINANLAMIAKENAALAVKGDLTKSEAAFSNELRNAEFTSRNKLILATQEQAAAETKLAQIQASSLEATQLKTSALTELATVNKSAAIATTQLTAATAANEAAQMASIAATEASAAAASKAKWAWLSLGNAVNVLFAVYAGWEIGSWLNKFESVRVAGAAMVGGLIETWNRFLFVLDRVKASANPFGNGDEQIAALNRINEAEKQWKITHDQTMADVFKGTETAPSATKPYQNDQAAIEAANKAKADAATAAAKAAAAKAAEADISSYNSFVTAFNSKISAIEEANPLLSQHEKELLKIADAEAAMIVQYPKHTGEIKKLYAWINQETKAYQEHEQAIKNTSTEFKNLLAMWEADTATPQHNDAGQFSITNDQIIKLMNTLSGQTAIDDFNEKLRWLNGLMSESPERAAEISSAIAKLTADFNAIGLGRSIADISNQLSQVDMAEKTYSLSTEQAAQKRIELLDKQLVAQRAVYDSIPGDSDAGKAAQLQYQTAIISTTRSLQDQQILLRDRTAIGGMTAAIHKYNDDTTNIGKQVEQTFTSTFKNIENSIVTAFQKGKFSASDMFDFVKAETARMLIAKPLTNTLAQQFNPGSGTQFDSAGNITASAVPQGALYKASPYIAAGAAVLLFADNLLSSSDESEKAFKTLTDALKDMATSVHAQTQRLTGQSNQAALSELGTKQAQESRDLKSMQDDRWKYLMGSMIAASGNIEAVIAYQKRISEANAQSIKESGDLLALHNLQIQAVKDEQNATFNKLKLQQLEMQALKGTTEYISALNSIRAVELNKLDDVKNASGESERSVQAMIYALEDQAAAAEKATAALAYNADLTTRLLAASGQDKLSSLYALQVKQEKELADARKNGMDTAMLVQVQQLEMANAMKTASETISEATQKIIATAKTALTDAVSLNTTILGTMRELLSGASAQLSPEAAYQQAKSQFATADASNVSDRVTAFMTASQAYNGSGQSYQTDRLAALDKLSQFAETAPTLSNVERQIQLLGEIKSAVESGDAALISATQITYNAAQIDMGTARNALTIALEGIQSALNTPITAGTASGAITGQISALQSSINTGIMDGTAKSVITAQISGLQNTFNSPVYDGTAKAAMAGQITALQNTINTTVMDGTTKTALLAQITAFSAATNTYVPDGTAKTAIQAEINALQTKLNTGVTGSAKDAISNSIGALQLALNGTISAATAQASISGAYSTVQGALNGTISGTVAANSLATQYSITQAALNGTISSAAATQALQTVYGTVQSALNGTISSTTATQAIGTVYATVQGALNGTVSGSAAASAIGSTYSTIQGALNGTISGATAATTIAGQYGSVTSALDSGLNVGTNSISSLLSTFNDSLTASAKTTRDGLLNFTNALAIVSDYTRQRTDAQAALGSLSSQYRAGTITGDQYTTQAATALAPLNSTISAGAALGLTSLSAPTSGITSEDIDARMKTLFTSLTKPGGELYEIAYGHVPASATQLAKYDIAPFVNGKPQPNGTIDLLDLYVGQNFATGLSKWSTIGLPAFADGTNNLPYDMIAQVHEGERIIPKADNYELMRRLDSPADNKELVAAIDKLEKRLEKIERNTEGGNRIAQAVGQQTIEIGKRQERKLEDLANTARVAA